MLEGNDLLLHIATHLEPFPHAANAILGVLNWKPPRATGAIPASSKDVRASEEKSELQRIVAIPQVRTSEEWITVSITFLCVMLR
jgi:hypothetical protein